MRCSPGAVCEIVATSPGRKANLGARVTVTCLAPMLSTLGVAGWQFKDASRPLIVMGVENGNAKMATSSEELPEYWVWLRDADLRPIPDHSHA